MRWTLHGVMESNFSRQKYRYIREKLEHFRILLSWIYSQWDMSDLQPRREHEKGGGHEHKSAPLGAQNAMNAVKAQRGSMGALFSEDTKTLSIRSWLGWPPCRTTCCRSGAESLNAESLKAPWRRSGQWSAHGGGGRRSPKKDGRCDTASRKHRVSTDLSGGSGLNWLSSRRDMVPPCRPSVRRQQLSTGKNPELFFLFVSFPPSVGGGLSSDRWRITHGGNKTSGHVEVWIILYLLD